MFSLAREQPMFIVPAPSLVKAEIRDGLREATDNGQRAFVYLNAKLGGEVSLSPTPASPELSFDITIVEIAKLGDVLTEVSYAILEAQTMDFHGSYRAVVKNLEDALRLHGPSFHRELEKNRRWLSQDIEGPNIANVFKRTFYQIMLKFQIAGHGACVGCALALPAAVWDSWQRHLGRPELVPQADGTFVLRRPRASEAKPAWIYVFDIVPSATTSPNKIVLKKVIATDAESVGHYALKVAPEAALAAGGAADRVLRSINFRLRNWWPELSFPA